MRYDAEKNSLELSLDSPLGVSLAHLMLQSIFIYTAQTDEETAVVRQLKNMIDGKEPAVSVDLTERFFINE